MTNAGRPRKIAPEDALERVMDVFWEHGFAATSMNDLVSASGLHKGSLYATFGDKRALFTAALSHYLDERTAEQHADVAAGPTPLAGLRTMLHGMVTLTADAGGGPRGCLALKTLAEKDVHDDTVMDVLRRYFERDLALVAKTLAAAEDSGELDPLLPHEEAALQLMTFFAGVATLHGTALTSEEAMELVERQLILLGAPSHLTP